MLHLVIAWLIPTALTVIVTPLYLEGGYDIVEEKIRTVLMAPLAAALGLSYLVSLDHRVSGVIAHVALLIYLVLAIKLLVIKSRQRYYSLLLLQCAVILISCRGYYLMTCYWNDHGHG